MWIVAGLTALLLLGGWGGLWGRAPPSATGHLLPESTPARAGDAAHAEPGPPASRPATHVTRTVPVPGSVAPASGPLNVTDPYAVPPVLDEGQLLNLNVTVTGGVHPYNLTWLGLPSGCASQNSTRIFCRPGSPNGPTVAAISVRVVDSNGTTVVSGTTEVTINPTPSVAITGFPNVGLVPLNVTFAAETYYGTAPFRFFWSFGDGSNGTGPRVTHEYNLVGEFPITVWGNDSTGANVSGHFKIGVADPIVVALIVSPSATLSAGSTVTLEANATGGFPPYSYDWTGLPSGCTYLNASELTCQPGAAGTYAISVGVTDKVGFNGSGTIVLDVGSAPPAFPSLWMVVGLAAVLGVPVTVVIVVLYRRRRRRGPPRAWSGGAA